MRSTAPVLRMVQDRPLAAAAATAFDWLAPSAVAMSGATPIRPAMRALPATRRPSTVQSPAAPFGPVLSES